MVGPVIVAVADGVQLSTVIDVALTGPEVFVIRMGIAIMSYPMGRARLVARPMVGKEDYAAVVTGKGFRPRLSNRGSIVLSARSTLRRRA